MDNRIYLERRARLMREVSAGLIVVRGGGAEGVNPNLVYLTGIREPRAALVLARAGVRVGTGRRSPGPAYVLGRQA
ncbi:MAG TPA: hypothetical protein VD788_13700, partial [Candidatus Polarisedimenticolaceae bacterium]|nr:hypothetical protein [Candidatus Polarisedimenticolaceae bacterium]